MKPPFRYVKQFKDRHGTVREHPDSGTQECCGLFIFSDGEQVCCGEPVVRAPVEHPNSAGANND